MPNSREQKKRGYHYTKKKSVVAIVIDPQGNETTVTARKFHTQDLPQVLKKFIADMQRLFPTATHVNFYDTQKNFIRREQLQPDLFTKQEKKLTKCKENNLDPVTKCIFENSLY